MVLVRLLQFVAHILEWITYHHDTQSDRLISNFVASYSENVTGIGYAFAFITVSANRVIAVIGFRKAVAIVIGTTMMNGNSATRANRAEALRPFMTNQPMAIALPAIAKLELTLGMFAQRSISLNRGNGTQPNDNACGNDPHRHFKDTQNLVFIVHLDKGK